MARRQHLTDTERRDTVDARIEYEIRLAERFGDEQTAAQLRRDRLENALDGFHFDRRGSPKRLENRTTEHARG
ncbi:hypothetical protein [Tenggerimyces flavus]|uniref:Uncharacterized protein n=1 Tax=Tenggerimyces flavus TaxID=1708749 RepID=A0ABV7YA75_9ACTN|nr:hypothetical protein [Tenggerimyces flavus]MBM7788873.1 hypothetical protein [Tenggerimyces flavus]